MQYSDETLIDLILNELFNKGGNMYLGKEILSPNKIDVDNNELKRIKNKLNAIKIADITGDCYADPMIKISDEGISIMQLYGSYSSFLEEKKMEHKVYIENERLKNTSMKLNNMKLSISLIISIISFIVTLLSLIYYTDEVHSLKDILRKNNIEIPN